jgi:CheY-like chemotaxis protein
LKRKEPLGKILIDAGYIDEDQFKAALGRQRRYGGRLASQIYTLGFVDERTLLVLLARQLGYPGVELRRSTIPVANADILPREIAERYLALSAAVERDRILMVLSNPSDVKVLDELRFLTGKRIVPHLGLNVLVEETIQQLYAARHSGRTELVRGVDAEGYGVGERGHLEIVTAATALEPPAPPQPPTAGAAASPARDPAPEPDSAPISPSSSADGSSGLHEIPPTPGARGADVLVAEDDPDIRLHLRDALGGRGHRVSTAAAAIEALQYLREHVPHAVVMSSLLPGMDRLDLCQKLRSSPKHTQVITVLLSPARRGGGYRRDLQVLTGARLVLEKPVYLPVLVRRLEELLTRAGVLESRYDPAQARAAKALAVGTQLLSDGKVDEAVDVLRRGLADDSLSEHLHFQLGTAYRRKSMDALAIDALERAIELNGEHYPALQALAALYQERGYRRRSFEIWTRALEHAPDDETRRRIREHLTSYLRG